MKKGIWIVCLPCRGAFQVHAEWSSRTLPGVDEIEVLVKGGYRDISSPEVVLVVCGQSL